MSITTRALSEAHSTAVHYQAGFIVLSYLISLVGCSSTLELLHRRTSCRGAFNWYLLIASSITMGGIGIWSMHFVGNRAIILANGAANRQLLYNQGWTALSFFLPIVVLLIAFYLLAVSGKATKVNIVISGLLTGTAVCAMHYVGQVGIANYDCTYQIPNIVGAAIIAVVASLIALSVFFRLRDTWTDSWWKRTLCAALLACAVSGMHWTAAVGTVYHFRVDGMSRGSRSRTQTVVFCAVLSVASCVFLLAIALLRRHRSRTHRRRAQELVLACVYFDENDRVMVSHDGFLPYQKITNQFVRKTFGEDELSRSHPAFMWVYEASRNWSTLRELVPGMQNRLDSDPVARRYQPGHERSIDLSSASTDFDIIFKQLFCVAAQRLANQVHERLEDLGIMFEEPLETGITNTGKRAPNRLSRIKKLDLEKNNTAEIFGKGRYLFLNRKLNRNEAANFAALGYRFGSVSHISESLARNMQVNQADMLSRLDRMKICMSQERLYPAGIHLAGFLLRPNVHAGFDILVPNVIQNQLPLVTLSVTEITPSQKTLLRSIDEWTLRDILKELVSEQPEASQQDKEFRWELNSAFVKLVDLVKDSETMMEAKFSAQFVHAPSRNPSGSGTPARCTIFSIRHLGSIHSSYSREALTYVPFDFFYAQQLLETSATRHQAFKQKAEQEFGDSANQSMRQVTNETKSITSGVPRQGQKEKDTVLSGPRSLLSKLGFSKSTSSRQSSKTGIFFGGQHSGHSTTEPDVPASPTDRKNIDVTLDEIKAVPPLDLSSVSLVEPQGSAQQNKDEIVSVPAVSSGKTFVSELFALFRLSTSSEKEKTREIG